MGHNEGVGRNERTRIKLIIMKTKYPFEEGDDYYIVLKYKDKVYNLPEYKIIESCWDDVSEEIYDIDSSRELFKSREDAQEHINQLKN